jgi:hypothetical protein
MKRKMIILMIALMLVIVKADWVSPPSGGGGGDTYNNYYNNTYFNEFDQDLNTTSDVNFNGITLNGNPFTFDTVYLNLSSGGVPMISMYTFTDEESYDWGVMKLYLNGNQRIVLDAETGKIFAKDWTNVSITTSQISDYSPGGSGTVINPTLLESVVITSDATSFNGLVNKAATNMNFTLISGNYYTVDFHVLYRSNDTTNGVKFGVETPTFTFISGDVMINGQAATGTDSDVNGQLIASNGTVTSTAVAVKDTTYAALIHVHILPSANGNIRLIYSNELAACNVTIKQGSSATLTNYTPIGAGAPGK